ncbi:MAG: iron donor protein CyaY [Zoogloeaceae bacterium]|jgi:CyaY protein|nr:iron donor protein CyaY [Zoogloeaceae bacterium]
MEEAEFYRLQEHLWAILEEKLDAQDADYELSPGVIEVTQADGGKVIINRHTPLREIWVATRENGYHFKRENDCWHDTRHGRELMGFLAEVLGFDS